MTDKKENESKEITFKEFKFKELLEKAINEAGYKNPSPVQELSIPIILNGDDLISQAQTGTGKTAAFGLPIIEMMDGKSGIETLVIAPTRELAMQISDELWKFTRLLGYKTTSVFGGSSYKKQINFINNSSILVATPGRLLDLLKKKLIKINPKFVVLDEADEMLNMGFIEDIKNIFEFLPEDRQTLMFSATMPDAIKKLAIDILKNPKEVKITPKNISNENITQYYYLIEEEKKKEALLQLLRNIDSKKTIVFTKTKVQVDRLNEFLNKNRIKSLGLHGDIEQWQRREITKSFKSREYRYLVATDVAARGLDIKNISHVINFDIPTNPEPYVHRIGRTGRAGKTGEAHTFVSLNEIEFLKEIQEVVKSKLIAAEIPVSQYFKEKHLDEIKSKILNQKANRNTNKILSSLLKENKKDELLEKLVSYILEEEKETGNEFSASKIQAEKVLENFIKVKKSGSKRNYSRKSGGRNQRFSKPRREEKVYNWK